MRHYLLSALCCGAILLTGSSSGADTVLLEPLSETLPFGLGINTTGLHDKHDTFDQSGDGTADRLVRLNPIAPLELANFTPDYLSVLTTEFAAPSWTFSVAAGGLSDGSLRVRTYDAQHDKVGLLNRVGAQFHVEYVPSPGDPTTNLHWIQVVWNNDKLPDPTGQSIGTIDFSVDNPFASGTPFYDDGGAANANDFYDFPRRIDIGGDLIWNAQLFLVQDLPLGQGGEVTLLGGIGWGWQTVAVPEPGSFVLFAIAFGSIGTLRCCRGWRPRSLDRGRRFCSRTACNRRSQ